MRNKWAETAARGFARGVGYQAARRLPTGWIIGLMIAAAVVLWLIP